MLLILPIEWPARPRPARDAMVRYRLSMNSVRSRAMNVSQSPVVGEFENMLPLYFVKASGTSVDRAKPAIRRHFETGHFQCAGSRPSEFYRTCSPDCKSVWTFVRQLRG